MIVFRFRNGPQTYVSVQSKEYKWKLVQTLSNPTEDTHDILRHDSYIYDTEDKAIHDLFELAKMQNMERIS